LQIFLAPESAAARAEGHLKERIEQIDLKNLPMPRRPSAGRAVGQLYGV
jgi:hypothetical protein